MKILMLVNWKVKQVNDIPKDIQAPDYYCKKEKYWFFKYFKDDVKVDVIDISSCGFWEKIERKYLHFYIVQTIKAIKKMKEYDIVISHGMPSGILLALFRRFFETKTKHVVFDIGAFNSAKESGTILKINQFASKSIDGIIYHESQQIEYYKKYFPWLVKKSKFIHFGTDTKYFFRDVDSVDVNKKEDKNKFILSIGYNMRDNQTLEEAFKKLNIDNCKLRIIGSSKKKYTEENIEYWPPIPKRELNQQIQEALFCVLPLEYKNYSFGQMTLLQQMYYNKILITADVPSVKDYVENKKTAIIYKHGNVEDLREKMQYVYNNYKNIQYIGIQAKKTVEEKYNEENMAYEVEIFLNEVIL